MIINPFRRGNGTTPPPPPPTTTTTTSNESPLTQQQQQQDHVVVAVVSDDNVTTSSSNSNHHHPGILKGIQEHQQQGINAQQQKQQRPIVSSSATITNTTNTTTTATSNNNVTNTTTKNNSISTFPYRNSNNSMNSESGTNMIPNDGELLPDDKDDIQFHLNHNNNNKNDDIQQQQRYSTSTELILKVSDLMNDNKIVFRYGLYATIGTLTFYGIMKTPLFFKYRTIMEVPSNSFIQRQTIHCRIIKIEQQTQSQIQQQVQHVKQPYPSYYGASSSSIPPQQQSDDDDIVVPVQPIVLYVRHLSFVERFLSKKTLHYLWNFHPIRSFLTKYLDHNDNNDNNNLTTIPQNNDLLRVQLAGVQQAPPIVRVQQQKQQQLLQQQNGINNNNNNNRTSKKRFVPMDGNGEKWLQHLANEQVHVKCTLLGRKVQTTSTNIQDSSDTKLERMKRLIPELDTSKTGRETKIKYDTNRTIGSSSSSTSQPTAVVTLSYRSSMNPFVPRKDLGYTLVRYGQANVVSPAIGLFLHDTTTNTPNHETFLDIDHMKDTPIQTLQNDSKYMKQLYDGEYKACYDQYGMWSYDHTITKQIRPDLVQEIQYQKNTPWYQKIWYSFLWKSK